MSTREPLFRANFGDYEVEVIGDWDKDTDREFGELIVLSLWGLVRDLARGGGGVTDN